MISSQQECHVKMSLLRAGLPAPASGRQDPREVGVPLLLTGDWQFYEKLISPGTKLVG